MCICCDTRNAKIPKAKDTHSLNKRTKCKKKTNRTAAKKFSSFIEILNNTKRKEFHGKTENNK